MRAFSLTADSKTNITMDYDDIRNQFDDAIKKYDSNHTSQKTRFGEAELGMAPLLSWMANQGGTVDFISKRFVFTTDKDLDSWATRQPAAAGA